MAGLVRTTLLATRWPLAIFAFLIAFNAKAGADDVVNPPEPPRMTLTLT